MTPACSIVIRCCNEERHIGRLLQGIMEQTVKNIEIIVVDSGSSDGTLDVARQYPSKILEIAPGEFSFGKSLNIGCRAVRGNYIVVASAHVYPVYTDWLERLLAPFSDPQVALVYGKQRGNETTKYSEHRLFAQWFPEEPVSKENSPFCSNANAVVRRSVWKQLPYDETLTGLEDVNWAKRAIERGYRILYAPDAEVIHAHSERWRHVYNRYRREAIAYKRIFPDERFTLLDFTRLSIANVASDYYHARLDGKLLRNLGGIFMFRLMQFCGAYRGFGQRGLVSAALKQRFYYPNGLSRSEPNSGGPDIARTQVKYG